MASKRLPASCHSGLSEKAVPEVDVDAGAASHGIGNMALHFLEDGGVGERSSVGNTDAMRSTTLRKRSRSRGPEIVEMIFKIGGMRFYWDAPEVSGCKYTLNADTERDVSASVPIGLCVTRFIANAGGMIISLTLLRQIA